MNYLLDAMKHIGIYYTPQSVLALGTGDGKTRAPYDVVGIVGNPPFGGHMNEITLGSPAYRRLARRFARLDAFSRARGLWPDEREELERISAAMDYAKARHGIADLVDDYTFAVGQAGNLGGTES